MGPSLSKDQIRQAYTAKQETNKEQMERNRIMLDPIRSAHDVLKPQANKANITLADIPAAVSAICIALDSLLRAQILQLESVNAALYEEQSKITDALKQLDSPLALPSLIHPDLSRH